MNGQGKVFIKILVKELLMRSVIFLSVLIYGVLINNFFVFEVAASGPVFSANSKQDLDKMRVACTTGDAIYHPEVLDIEEVNRKADEAAKRAVEQEARETEEYVEDCIEKEGFLQEGLSCKRRGEYANRQLYREYFDEARRKFFSEALKERNEAFLEREREYLEELLSQREQARQKSQEVVSAYESARSIDSSGEREREIQAEIEEKRNHAVDYLNDEWELVFRVGRCYRVLDAVTTGVEEYRDYNHDFKIKELANRKDQDSVEEILRKLGSPIIHITGDEKYISDARGWYRIVD